MRRPVLPSRALWALFAGVLVAGTWTHAGARDMFSGVSDAPPADQVVLFATAAASTAVLLATRNRRAATAVVAVVLLAVSVGVSGQQNTWSTYPTHHSVERSLVARVAGDPNGPIAQAWTTFADIGVLLRGRSIIVPDRTWRTYIEEVAELAYVVDPDYDPTIRADDPRLGGLWLHDSNLSGEVHLVVVGESATYRWYRTSEHEFLLAEDP